MAIEREQITDPKEQKFLFNEFIRAANSVLNRWPLYPIIGDVTMEGIRKFPGYDVFHTLDNETQYLLFMNALMGSLKSGVMLAQLDSAVAEKSSSK